MKPKLPKILESKFIALILFLLLVGGVYLQYQKFTKQQAIDREIENLIKEEQGLTQKNQELEQSLKFFSSSEYQEKLAKEQLGLQKEGEVVVNFPQDDFKDESRNINQEQLSNPMKWWNYLFKNNQAKS